RERFSCSYLWRHFHFDFDIRSHIDGASQRDSSPVPAHDALRDRQTQTAADGARVLRTIEAAEDVGCVMRGNADAMIRELDDDITSLPSSGDQQPTVFAGVLDRVVDNGFKDLND